MSLNTGTIAPDFTAIDQHNTSHTLSGYKGKYVVLYFYPKDDTPGCTTEACSFRDNYAQLQEKAVLLGVSNDTASSHQQFATKYSLPFPLLADPDGTIIKNYQADGLVFNKRITYIIDPEGKISKVYDSVDVNTHVQEVLEALS